MQNKIGWISLRTSALTAYVINKKLSALNEVVTKG